MKHLLTSFLLFVGLTSLAQPTYLDLTLQLDNYPAETSWVITQDSNIVITSPSYVGVAPGTLVEQRIFLDSNIDYTFTITDSFGDGICCGWGEGFFLSANNCEGIIFEDYEFDSSVVSYNFNLEPCEIPTSDITFRVNLANAPPEIETPGVLGSWNGWQVIPMEYDEDDEWFITIPIQEGNYLWKFADYNDPSIQELPVGVDGNSCFLFDGNGFVNRTLDVIEEENQLLPNYCWESCLPCGAIPGCTDFGAINWNPWANYDNGSCITQNTECAPGESLLEIIVTPDLFTGGETSWLLYGPNDQTYATAPLGTYAGSPAGIPISNTVCVTSGGEYDLVIEDTYGDGLCGSCFSNSDINGNIEVLDCNGDLLWSLLDEYPNGNFGYVTTSATFSPPTSCGLIEVVAGCTDPSYVEYNPEATTFLEGSCITPVVVGCTDSTQFNYNPEANTEDIIESCEFTLTITDGVGDGWFGSWLGIWQFGFNSPQYQMGPDDGTELSFNINLDATQPAYVYFFVTPQSIGTTQQCGFTLTNPGGEVIIDIPFFNIIPFINESGWYKYEINPYCGNTCEPYVYGCLDETAFNYIAEANTEDNSCYYNPGCTSPAFLEYHTQGFVADYDNGDCQVLAEFGCMDNTQFNYDPDATVQWNSATDPTDPCVPIVEGCMDPLALNFDPLANVNNFDCVDAIYGCTDPTAFNYNELANVDNDSCEDIVEGCTDPSAFNFNPDANTEDFSCEEIVYGCTDPQAANYDEEANTDNGSCESVYANCVDPVIETYNLLELGNECFAWVIDVSPSCCNSEWANGCQELYNYCDENTVTNIIEYGENEIVVFPNPTRDIITIASNLNVNATLYNVIGQPIYQNNNVNQIDISGYEAGIYTLILTYNNLQFTKKIVKQ